MKFPTILPKPKDSTGLYLQSINQSKLCLLKQGYNNSTGIELERKQKQKKGNKHISKKWQHQDVSRYHNLLYYIRSTFITTLL